MCVCVNVARVYAFDGAARLKQEKREMYIACMHGKATIETERERVRNLL